jgi:hypothetical protein
VAQVTERLLAGRGGTVISSDWTAPELVSLTAARGG